MATLPTSSRLLAKVAKFVRNPSVHWSDLDKIAAEGESGTTSGAESDLAIEPTLAHNRQTLKDMIDRKRNEDAIRKCEFDELRQLRRQASLAKSDAGDKPTSLGVPTNLSDLDERAMTLRKIDEIEAQMSRQWWKGQKPGPVADSGPSSLGAQTTGASDDSLFASTQVKHSRMDFDDIPTLLGQVPTLQNGTSSFDSDLLPDTDVPRNAVTDARGFDSAKLLVSELNDNLSDPDLEEAAVRFANGDDAGAESVLLTALRAHPVLTVVAQAQAEALFDLYRSLGQQASFAREAENFTRQFACQAPVWAPLFQAPEPQQAPPPALVWRSPAQLDVPALASLPEELPVADCLSLDWSGLREITAAAAQRLASLFATWSAQPGCLEFQGEQVLVQLVRAATPRGARQTAAYWWDLRMSLLRVLQWQDDFELAAFEYCMTFEVATDAWVPATCGLRQPGAAGVKASASQTPAAPSARTNAVALVGELFGDVVTGLPALVDSSRPKQHLVISCQQLIRVDFSAAGSLLNWVAQGQALGHQIEFRDVPFLVAAFFNLIGINQHAQVLTRSH